METRENSMPRELVAVMIKTSGNPQALSPSIHHFDVSTSTATTQGMLESVKEKFPSALNPDQDGAMLLPSQAQTILELWRREIRDGIFVSGCSRVDQIVYEMHELSQDGHSMILTEA